MGRYLAKIEKETGGKVHAYWKGGTLILSRWSEGYKAWVEQPYRTCYYGMKKTEIEKQAYLRVCGKEV